MDLRAAARRPRNWIFAVVAVVVLVAVVGPFVYINFVQDDPPERLTLDEPDEADGTPSVDDPPATTGADAGVEGDNDDDDLAGTWAIGDGSEAGYRVREVLFGQGTEAVGRTSEVTGEMEIDGTTVTEATFTVDMTTITSDEDRRDNQFHGRIMDTAAHPAAEFVLDDPIEIGVLPAEGEQVTRRVTGTFTIRGVPKTVTFDLTARRTGDVIEANGAIPVVFADHEIPDASFGPAVVEDNGEIEFLLSFERA
jgi:polyisoprenoid-binding protein YceI